MESTSNRRLLIIVGFVLFIMVIVLVWYFFYAKPTTSPSLSGTRDPLKVNGTSIRERFITWGNEEGTSTTEVFDPLKDPLVEVWRKPATGQTFISRTVLQEVLATSTEGTSTIAIKKTIRATSTVLLFVDKTTVSFTY